MSEVLSSDTQARQVEVKALRRFGLPLVGCQLLQSHICLPVRGKRAGLGLKHSCLQQPTM